MAKQALFLRALVVAALSCHATASSVLESTSFTNCASDNTVTVQRANIKYNNDDKTITFDVAGTAPESLKVMAALDVTAYGVSAYSKSFNPCDNSTFIEQLCPIPAGVFTAAGSEQVPTSYANQIPSIAFSVPDISAEAVIKLTAIDTGSTVACITLQVTNGKTASITAISYASAAIAGAALLLAGATSIVGALSAGSAASIGGAGTTSPGLGQVMTWFQGMAMNGMMSVSYPPIYRAFTQNFAFATGIIPWTSMQTSIDSFRGVTGGNLTEANAQYLKNATLVFGDGSTSTVSRRAIWAREVATSVNSTTTSNSTSVVDEIKIKVSGIAAYVEELAVPHQNTFMTALLIVAIVIAAIVVSILLVKVVLEVWALFGSFPKALTGFRKHYWGTMARTITQLVLILYGTLMLYSIYQFVDGDSWGAKLLAGLVIAVSTGCLAFFTFKISQMAKKSKAAEGDASLLYNDKDVWLKYSIFYDGYKKDFWWTFVPVIVYMFAKGATLALGDGHGMAQTIAQIVIETAMLLFLIFVRPHERKSGNVVGIMIQVVRALSVIIILIFVDELGVPQTAQTVAGVVLMAVQAGLTGLLAILICVNAIILCCNENPHRKRRKAAEKAALEAENNLTPLHADNGLLMKMGSQRSSDGNSRYQYNDKKDPSIYEYDMDGQNHPGPKYPLLKTSTSNGTLNGANEGANPYNNNTMQPIATSYDGGLGRKASAGSGLKGYTPARQNESVDEGRHGLIVNAAPPANLYGGYRGVS